MAAGLAAGLVDRLTAVRLLLVCSMLMAVGCIARVVVLRAIHSLHRMCRMFVAAARRRRKCCQTLHRQGQQQQPDGNQARGLHEMAV